MVRTLNLRALICWIGFAVSVTVVAHAEGKPSNSSRDQSARSNGRLMPGLVYVFFNDTGFQRPASHRAEEGIRDQGKTITIEACGVEEQVNMDLTGVHDFSKLWLGFIRFPRTGEVTMSAEADNGLYLFINGKTVIDGWSLTGERQGKVIVKSGQALPIRLDYFQDGGPAYMRLYWSCKDHPRELVPPSALWHDQKDLQRAKALAERRQAVTPGSLNPAVTAPQGDEEFKSSLYQPDSVTRNRDGAPIRLGSGPHLFIDDYLIEASSNLKRRVNRPARDPQIPNPIVTGKEDRCFQPYMTILRDPETKRFRLWYGAWADGKDTATSHLGYMESEDGLHWIRPIRILDDPGPIQFGVSVIDEGRQFRELSKRYKYAWWKDGGMKVAASPDGLKWTPLSPHVVLHHNHDINNLFRDDLRKRYVATVSVYTTGPTWKGLRRATMQSVSQDLLHWEKPWYVIAPDDHVDEGETQFYAMAGYLLRGHLWIGLVKVLRDDLRASATPEGSFGIGYTTLAWSRDGEHWVRDREPFFEPDPAPGAWDHAHAWMDYQLPVGDEVYIYYGGYKNGHKVNRFEERQIGVVRMRRDRYVSREAGDADGSLMTPEVILEATKITVNAAVEGELRLRLCDTKGKPIPGFDWADCKPIQGDSIAHPVRWKRSLASLRGKPVHLEFSLRRAQLFSFDLDR